MKNFKVTRIKENDPKPTRYFSSKQEKKVAKELGGKPTKNSGATLFDKGDVKLDDFLIECKTKTTLSESIAIKKEWITKLNQECLFEGKDNWALAFNFGPGCPNYYIIDEALFKQLINKE